jgi:hypothetical protein
VDHHGADRGPERAYLAQKALAGVVPVQHDRHHRRDLAEPLEKGGADRPEGWLGTGLEAGQHVEDVLEVCEATSCSHLVEVRPGGEHVHDVLGSAEEVRDRGRDRDRSLEEAPVPGSGPLRQERVEHDRNPAEILLLVLLHYRRPPAGPRAPVDAAEGITLPIVTGTDELDRVADIRGERDAARLVASAQRHGELLHAPEPRVRDERLVGETGRPTGHEAERVRRPQGRSLQDISPPLPDLDLERDFGCFVRARGEERLLRTDDERVHVLRPRPKREAEVGEQAPGAPHTRPHRKGAARGGSCGQGALESRAGWGPERKG